MIQVSIEVGEGAALFRVPVRAKSITRAVSTMEGRYPGRSVRVVFPVDPEGFFVGVPKETGAEWDESRRALHAPMMRI
jgi:hypothetical protein